MNGKFWGNLGLSVVILSLVAFGVTKISASPGIEGLLLPEVKIADATEDLLRSVTLVRSAVKVHKGDHRVDAFFGIANGGEHDIKNVSILCTLYDGDGKEQGRDKWIVFDTVKSHRQGMFTFSDKMFVSDRVVRSDCRIVDMEIVKPPFITVHRAAAGHDEHGGTAPDDSGHGGHH